MSKKGGKTADSTNKIAIICGMFGAIFGAILGLLAYTNNWLG